MHILPSLVYLMEGCMYPMTSPTELYNEYQARVAKAVRQHQLAAEAQRRPSLLAVLFARIEAWLTTIHIYPARNEVAEDGYLA